MKLRALVLACMLVAPAVQAMEIYRWVDETGRVHYSDSVPQKYKKGAAVIDTREMEISAAQRQESAERAARERAFVEEAQRRRERDEALSSADARYLAPQAPQVGDLARQLVVPPNASCATRQQLYRESQECFAPFRMVRGGLRPEAFLVCGRGIPDPAPECGQPNY